jgi:alpha-galactosidase
VDITSVLSFSNLKYSQPGGFNDMDMLEVGNGGMSITEYKSHFTLWAVFKSPLILGNDLTRLTPEISSIIKNKELIAINQDPLGLSVSLDERIYDDLGQALIDIYIGPLANDQEVLGILFI